MCILIFLSNNVLLSNVFIIHLYFVIHWYFNTTLNKGQKLFSRSWKLRTKMTRSTFSVYLFKVVIEGSFICLRRMASFSTRIEAFCTIAFCRWNIKIFTTPERCQPACELSQFTPWPKMHEKSGGGDLDICKGRRTSS